MKSVMSLQEADAPPTAPGVATREPGKNTNTAHQHGHVEVVRLRRRSRKHPELLLFRGAPSSKHSVARSVQVTISPVNGKPVPPASLDPEKERIHLHYPSMEHPDVQALLASPGDYLCYLWVSGDGKQSHAWLLKAR